MSLLFKFETRKLTRSEKEKISGGLASPGRCQAMMARYVERENENPGENERLWNRIRKNCPANSGAEITSA
ncbi:hypothetical protein [uncultured Aquimarina sp.]|uniref:hypothetical protein n=1 Tax=uncultured Aquimarina sp. TaxID=575652 RepID=UPI00261B7196|nr:hypothetical protein [uncultured Aquimarina sp.]